MKKIVDFIQNIYHTKEFLPLHEPRFIGNEKKYLNDCIDSTFVSSVGKYVDRFEDEFAKRIGLHPQTVRTMIKRGEIKPYITPSGQYRFTEEHVNQVLGIRKKKNGKVVIYARVSTQKQKSYLENQINVCKQFLVSKGLQIDEIITDTASSFNFKRKGLNKLLDMSFGGEIKVICIYSKDRLSRVAYDLFEQILKRLGIEILIVDN